MGTAGVAAAADGSTGASSSSSSSSASSSAADKDSDNGASTDSETTNTDANDTDDSDTDDAGTHDTDTDADDTDTDTDTDDAGAEDSDSSEDDTEAEDDTDTDGDDAAADSGEDTAAVKPVSSGSGDGYQNTNTSEPQTSVKAVSVKTEADAAVEPAGKASDIAEVPAALTSATPEAQVTASTAAVAETSTADAALVAGRVTVGTMIVDVMTWIGLPPPPSAARLLPIGLPGFVESFWVSLRTQMYRTPGQPAQPGGPPEPGQPQQPEQPGSGLPNSSDLPLVWETNFTSIDEALKYWGVQTGRWGQSAGENQYYTDFGNVYLNDEGHVVIVTRQETAPDGLGAPHNYTSTRLVTYGKASVTVGQRIVARIQMPYTQGSLPAFWTVGMEPGHEFDWPRQGEIDIVELPGFGDIDASKYWTGNIHGPAQGDNTVDVKLHGNDADIGVDLSQGFHEYGIDWYSDRIVWHVDGKQVGEITQAQYEALGGDWTPFSGAWPHYLILNNAVGNPWTGDPDETSVFPMEMTIDWVKVYDL
ncbi:family 16 glycosylhydrolase [Mycobacterium sp. MS1601]|uniref:family 16 glycosylhydrolase n=1 Tax=Mycobacterium sp. MS1601 TaxID=1936029 RepID=UPI001F0093E4|nr:family 16 glycosylhydrolase [Mycobacterium sp. MS1601]